MRIWTDNNDTSVWYFLAVQEVTNSHEYTMKPDEVHESWTKLTTITDW